MDAILPLLKIDLGITTTAYDARLTQYLEAALAEIEREGAYIETSNPGDVQLLVMYAAWMWRRRDNGEGMPRMVRYALNNKIFAGKMTE